MNNNKKYNKPAIEILDLKEDVILTSSATNGNFGQNETNEIAHGWIWGD